MKKVFTISLMQLFLVCLMTGFMPVRAEAGKHLFILSGQSNMRQPLPDAFRQFVSKVFGEDNEPNV